MKYDDATCEVEIGTPNDDDIMELKMKCKDGNVTKIDSTCTVNDMGMKCKMSGEAVKKRINDPAFQKDIFDIKWNKNEVLK